jgi:polysaccharide biosynthesis protein PslG
MTFCLRVAVCLLAATSAFAQTTPHIDSHLPSRMRDVDPAGFYQMQTAVADDYFDGTSSRARVRRHMQVANQVGAKYLRCAFTWNAIEKQKGKFDWRFWDMLVEEAERAHIQLIPYVAYTPEWAAEQSDEFWKRPPRNPQLYAEVMYQIAHRYRGRIHSWEIWNEPDIAEYWMGSVDGFAELVRQAAAAIRKADPSASLVLAGMSKGPSPMFEELITKHHIEQVVDVVAMHGYPESWLEEREETVLQQWPVRMNALINDDGLRRDLWLNELGYADYRYSATKANKYGISAAFPHEHTGKYAAVALFKAEVMALASGRVSLTGWYRIDDFDAKTTTFSDDEVNFHLGLLDWRGKPKPSFRSLRFFNHLFDQRLRTVLAPQLHSKSNSDAVMYALEKQDGHIVVVGWLRSLEPAEIAATDGSHPDGRIEIAAIQLPCAELSEVREFDAEGNSAAVDVTPVGGWLDGIQLTPDKVFIAEMRCDQRTSAITLPLAVPENLARR